MNPLMARGVTVVIACAVWTVVLGSHPSAQQTAAAPGRTAVTGAVAAVPPSYVIGAEDVLSVIFWRDKELSAEVVVRPDGKISLPLINDVQAAGYTPEQLSEAVKTAASKYIVGADATVIVKEIRSRRVFVVGEVAKPGRVALTGDMKVLQVIAEVGGFLDHAKKNDVIIIRNENGREQRFKFNYNQVVSGENVEQNILLQPGDTVLVR